MGIFFDDSSAERYVMDSVSSIMEYIDTYTVRMPRDRAMSFDIKDYGLSVPTVYDMFTTYAPSSATKITFKNPYGLFDQESRSEHFPIWFLKLDTFQYDGFYQSTPGIKYTVENDEYTVSIECDLEFTVDEGVLVWYHLPKKATSIYGSSEASMRFDALKCGKDIRISPSVPEHDVRAVEILLRL